MGATCVPFAHGIEGNPRLLPGGGIVRKETTTDAAHNCDNIKHIAVKRSKLTVLAVLQHM